jgi:succinate dehydrogenase / fumarate reductase, flavoprotein subunit
MKLHTSHAAFKAEENEIQENIKKLLSIKGEKTVDDIHRELGKSYVGVCWNVA